MCLRFVFLLALRAPTWLRLSRRPSAWKDAEILLLRHQVALLERRSAARPKPTWADLGRPGVVRSTAGRDTAGAARRAASPGHARNDPPLAPRPDQAPLDSEVTAQITRPPPSASHDHPARAADGPSQRTLGLPPHHRRTSRPWASPWHPRRSGRSSKRTASTPRHAAADRLGPSSCAPKPRRSSHATSSPLTYSTAPRPTSWPQSSTPPDASTSSEPPPTPPTHGSPNRPGTCSRTSTSQLTASSS